MASTRSSDSPALINFCVWRLRHALLDLRGNIPSFIFISDGKMHDVNLDQLLLEPGCVGPPRPLLRSNLGGPGSLSSEGQGSPLGHCGPADGNRNAALRASPGGARDQLFGTS